MAHEPYNPLDKLHLGESVARALLARPVAALPPSEPFDGAGVYVLYYTGDFPAYQKIAEANLNDEWAMPIYVGKAVPPGAGRYNQQRSLWDVVHPGRFWVAKLKPNARSLDEILSDIADFLG